MAAMQLLCQITLTTCFTARTLIASLIVLGVQRRRAGLGGNWSAW